MIQDRNTHFAGTLQLKQESWNVDGAACSVGTAGPHSPVHSGASSKDDFAAVLLAILKHMSINFFITEKQ